MLMMMISGVQSILLFTVYQENYFRQVRLVRRSVIDKRGAKGEQATEV
jgi:hypothetical protein